MKPKDKQEYLEEYEVFKKKGKPFFPYAVLKDSTMALIVVAVIIAMSIILGAEQGPKADPTSTTYVPRPEWYFFFNFRLLKLTSLRTSVYLTMALALGLVTWPFLEDALHRWLKMPRDVSVVLGVFGFLAFLTLTVWESFAG